MEKLTFKQYLESKEQLLGAVAAPSCFKEYVIGKYCTLPVGESFEEKQLVSLKPKQSLIVEWSTNSYISEPLSVRFLNVKNVDDEQQYSVLWNSKKINSWLKKNAGI